MRGWWDRFLMVAVMAVGVLIVLGVLNVTPAMAQDKPKADEKPVEVTAITEVESLRMQIAQLLDEIAQAGEAKRTVEKQRDQLRLQMVMMQSAPVREGFAYDWSVGAFRHLASGKVWDFASKSLIADDKTPKAKAEDPKVDKPGGGL